MNVITISEISTVIQAISTYCCTHHEEKVVVFLDIDNTLLRMSNCLGSDQWFRWQYQLILSNTPSHLGRVAKDITALQHVLLDLYTSQPCEACEDYAPQSIIFLLQNCKNLKLVFITARHDIMRNVSKKQINSLFETRIDYELIMCSGVCKANYIYNYIKQHNINSIFFVDDTYEHFDAFKNQDTNVHLHLYHYINQINHVKAFEKDSKESYIIMFDNWRRKHQLNPPCK